MYGLPDSLPAPDGYYGSTNHNKEEAPERYSQIEREIDSIYRSILEDNGFFETITINNNNSVLLTAPSNDNSSRIDNLRPETETSLDKPPHKKRIVSTSKNVVNKTLCNYTFEMNFAPQQTAYFGNTRKNQSKHAPNKKPYPQADELKPTGQNRYSNENFVRKNLIYNPALEMNSFHEQRFRLPASFGQIEDRQPKQAVNSPHDCENKKSAAVPETTPTKRIIYTSENFVNEDPALSLTFETNASPEQRFRLPTSFSQIENRQPKQSTNPHNCENQRSLPPAIERNPAEQIIYTNESFVSENDMYNNFFPLNFRAQQSFRDRPSQIEHNPPSGQFVANHQNSLNPNFSESSKIQKTKKRKFKLVDSGSASTTDALVTTPTIQFLFYKPVVTGGVILDAYENI